MKQNQNSQFLSGLVSELNLEAGDTVNLLDSLGPYCNKVGLTKTSLQNSDSIFFLNIFLAARHGFFLNEWINKTSILVLAQLAIIHSI